MIPWFKRKPAESVHLVVFKDQLPAKTLEVPLNWITKVGWGLSTLCLTTLVSLILAGQFYWQSLRASPGRVLELEKELTELKSSLTHSPQISNQTSDDSTTTESNDQETTGGTKGTTTAQTPVTLAPGAFPFPNLLFNPDQKVAPTQDSKSIDVADMNVRWQNRTLKVTFNIQYIKEDGGNQQGRIFIMTRGASSLNFYPEGVLSAAENTPKFVDPDQGERFSVSRFRGVLAEFGPFANKKEVNAVYVFLFDAQKNPLFYKKIPIEHGEDSP